MSFDRKHIGLFLSLIVLNFLNFSTYGIPITYFPNIAKLRGFSDAEIGVIFSMYPLVSFLSSFFVIKLLNKIDRKIVVAAGEITLGVSTVLFGFAVYFTSNAAFIAFSALGRGLQGLALGAYTTASYAYVPDIWPQEIDLRIIILEVFLSLGIGMGPLLGSAIYEFCGYIWIFVMPGGLIMIGGFLLTLLYFPSGVDEMTTMISREASKGKPNIGESLRIKQMIYLILGNVFALTGFTFIMPDYEIKVISAGGSSLTASVIFSMQPLGYVIACLFLLLAKFENRQGFLFLSLVFMLIGLVSLGLDLLVEMEGLALFLPMGIGLFSMGWSLSFSIIPFMSEAVWILKRKFKDKDEETLSNIAAGLLNAAIAWAEFQGPILGGILQDFCGFSRSCMIFAGVLAIFFMVFATHGEGYSNFRRFFNRGKPENKDGMNFNGEMPLLPDIEK